MTFVVKKKIDLSSYGEGWENAYITLTPFTIHDDEIIRSLRSAYLAAQPNPEDLKNANKKTIEILKEKLVEGKGFDGEKLIDITKDNFEDLPMEIIIEALQVLQGQVKLPPKE